MMAREGRVILGDSRCMAELDAESIDLVVTSPPYWHIKDYGVDGQVGYGQTLHEYLKDLYRVWRECHRVLRPGRRLCIDIGDQFARAKVYGRYKVIPLHAEIISQCEAIGFDYMGAIIWQKRTTMRPSGGATVMGSYPYPPNGLVEIDYENILLFKRPGKGTRPRAQAKERSRLSKEEWKEYFQGHWRFGGARQVGHEAMFPEELPKRLIRMFSFVGETVLDPFLGSGTTVRSAMDLDRKGIGYEINADFLDTIRKKLGCERGSAGKVAVERRRRKAPPCTVEGYSPSIKDTRPLKDGTTDGRAGDALLKVTKVIDQRTLELSDGSKVRLLGIFVKDKKRAIDYLRERVLKRKVLIRTHDRGGPATKKGVVEAYVYLKNRIFINSYMIKAGLAIPAKGPDHPMKGRFMDLTLAGSKRYKYKKGKKDMEKA